MLNSNFFILLLALLFSACSSGGQKVVQNTSQIPQESLEALKKRCDQEKVALACAQYGYRVKKDDPTEGLDYTEKACALKHEQSCFNVQQMKNRSLEHNFTVIRSQNDQVLSCYVTYSVDKQHARFYEEKKKQKVLNLEFLIDAKGKLARVTTKGRALTDDFKNCVDKVYSNKKFIGSQRSQLIQYDLVLPFIEGTKKFVNPSPYW